MHEPYEEKDDEDSRVKRFFQRLKNRVQNTSNRSFGGSDFFSRLRENRVALLAVLVAVLLVSGGYTGYVSYTSRVTQVEQQLLIQERQVNALNEELAGYKTSVAVCKTELENSQETLVRTDADLVDTEGRLTVCTTDYAQLVNSSSQTQSDLTALQNDYTGLEASSKGLECNFVEDKGCEYFTISDSDVQCCGKIDDNFYCGPQFVPTNSTSVKKFSEYC